MDPNEYADIIDLPHHVSEKRARMSMVDRGAQFSPFAALTGYDATIRETGRLTDACIELDEGGKALLDEKLRKLWEIIDTQPFVTITYFAPDERKSGGNYVRVAGHMKKIDTYTQTVILAEGTVIPIPRLYGIESDIL